MAVHKVESSPAEVAELILRKSPYHAIRLLKCRFREGVLTLGGRVPSYYLKQLAQSAVSKVDGVKRVENLIEVSV